MNMHRTGFVYWLFYFTPGGGEKQITPQEWAETTELPLSVLLRGSAVFPYEINDALLRANVSSVLSNNLRYLEQSLGFPGTCLCDESNNPLEMAATGNFQYDIFVNSQTGPEGPCTFHVLVRAF